MDADSNMPQQDTQYPDPEQSGLVLPWLDQYQPTIDLDMVSAGQSSSSEIASRPSHEKDDASVFLTDSNNLNPCPEPSALIEHIQAEDTLMPDVEDAASFSDQEQADVLRNARIPVGVQDGQAGVILSDELPGHVQSDRPFSPRAAASPGSQSRGQSRTRGRGRGRGRGSGRGASGRGRGRGGKGIKRGPRPALEPSKEFAALQKEALDVFIDKQDDEKALGLIQKAIALNPEVYAAHALMSEIYFARGDVEQGVAALFSGAHAAPRDTLVWQHVADACLQKPALDRNQALQRAAYCFARIIALTPDDLDARFQRAAINRELGLLTVAAREFDKILAVLPHNPSVLQQIAEICLELGHVEKAKGLYRDCIAYHQDQGLFGVDDHDAFSWSDLNIYLELFAKQEEFELGIVTLKSLSRALLGRADETYWDEVVDDDREWDPADSPRRVFLPHFVVNAHPSQSYGFGLPLELRVKLGVFRLRLGPTHRTEALNHFEWLEPDDQQPEAAIFQYPDLARHVAQALMDVKEHQEALRFLQPLRAHASHSDTSFWLSIADASFVCGHIEQARDSYELAKASDDTCAEARTQLAKIYQDTGHRQEALRNVREALELGRRAIVRPQRRRYERREAREAREAIEKELRDTYNMRVPSVDSMTARLRSVEVRDQRQKICSAFSTGPSERQAKLGYQIARSRKQAARNATRDMDEQQRTENIRSLYARLQELAPLMRGHESSWARLAWLECADELIQDFRSNKVFYPAERHVRFEGYDPDAKRRAFRKRWIKGYDDACESEFIGTPGADDWSPPPLSSVPTEYRGVSFESWLDVFLEQALTVAKLGEEFRSNSYETITAVLDCTIWYHQPQAMLKTHVCYFTCALALNDGETLSNVVARWFMREFKLATDVYRLFAALNLLYSGSIDRGTKQVRVKDLPFRQSINQKFLLRQIRALDARAKKSQARNKTIETSDGHAGRSQSHLSTLANKSDAETQSAAANLADSPPRMDVVLLSLYAAVMYTGNSFPNALHYLYRAYALDPGNPMLLLHMSLCYLHQSFKRQNENKHFYIMQGLALFQAYGDARRAKAAAEATTNDEVSSVGGDQEKTGLQEATREIEFNRARIWNMLNLTSLAVEGYKRVLEMSSDGLIEKPTATTEVLEQAERANDSHSSLDQSFSTNLEAAYALQLSYALSGNMHLARDITERWLVI